MKSHNWFASIDIKTIIYFAALMVIYAPLIITGKLTFDVFAYILTIATIIYVCFTKRWYFFEIAISLFITCFSIELLSSLFYQAAFSDSSFIVTSLGFGYFLILFITTSTNHAEWTIHSAWIGTTLGMLVALFVESAIIMLLHTRNVYLVGLSGLSSLLIISLVYIMTGRKVKVHEPNRYKDFDEELFQGSIEKHGFLAKRNKKNDLIIYDKTDKSKSYRTFFVKDKILFRDTGKIINDYIMVKNKKIIPIYSWLLRETTKSHEVKGPKPIKSEKFILINVAENTSEPKLIRIPLPRSKNKYTLGLITVSQKDIKKLNNILEKTIAMLNED